LDVAVEALELGVARKRRRLALTKVAEYQAEIFAHRIRPQLDLVAEGIVFGRLLNALAVAGKFPPVIEAAQVVTFDPGGRELKAEMRAAMIDDKNVAARAPIKGERLVQNAKRHRSLGKQVGRVIHRLPEPAKERPGRSSRAGGIKVIGG